MATQTIRICAPLEAGTYTVNVQRDGVNTNAYSDRPLTNTGIPVYWTFTVTDAIYGVYAFQVFDDTDTMVAWGWFYSDTNTVVTIQDANSREGVLALSRIGIPESGTLAGDLAVVQSDVDKVPKLGETHRYTRTSAGPAAADVAISEAP